MLTRLGRVFGRRGFRAVAILSVALLCTVAVAASQAATGGVGVLKVRLGGDRAETRIVLDMDRAATGKVTEDGEDSQRIVVSLSGVGADGGLQGPGQGLVKSWMVDDAPGGARLRLELTADAVIKRRFLLPPADGFSSYRYVIDVAARGPVPTVQPVSRPAPPRPVLSLKKVIVIDAGHGGKDPGARGAASNEKDINLAAARALKARLERSGRYQVVMTRESDVYVPLETRVQIARRADADLFISLHADSGPDADLRGASVYTLSDKAASRAAKFVSRDDWFMKASLAGGGVSDILLDLTQRATKNRSATFAELLLDRVSNETTLLRRSHREAGLVVLLAPDVPAVLLEMGFVNNRQDELMLRDPKRRARFMGAVGDSIDSYFERQTRLASR